MLNKRLKVRHYLNYADGQFYRSWSTLEVKVSALDQEIGKCCESVGMGR